jgi:2-phosphoglycerate kinase
MRVFISHSHQDQPAVDKIISRLKGEGHDVWVDSLKIRPGDNFQRKIQEGIESADAMIVVISNNSFRSQWVQHEFSAIALQQISKRERRIIPVRIDQSDVPSYLADRVYLDLSENFEYGLERLVEALRSETPESLALQT